MVLAIPCGKALNRFFESKALTNETKCSEVLSSTTFFHWWEILPNQFAKNHCNLFSVLLNATVLTTRVQLKNQFIFTEADIQMFENENQCDVRVTRICATFSNSLP